MGKCLLEKTRAVSETRLASRVSRPARYFFACTALCIGPMSGLHPATFTRLIAPGAETRLPYRYAGVQFQSMTLCAHVLLCRSMVYTCSTGGGDVVAAHVVQGY